MTEVLRQRSKIVRSMNHNLRLLAILSLCNYYIVESFFLSSHHLDCHPASKKSGFCQARRRTICRHRFLVQPLQNITEWGFIKWATSSEISEEEKENSGAMPYSGRTWEIASRSTPISSGFVFNPCMQISCPSWWIVSLELRLFRPMMRDNHYRFSSEPLTHSMYSMKKLNSHL